MYRNEEFGRMYILYRAEGVPQGESIQKFCIRNNVPYNLFNKWFRDSLHKIVEVKLSGKPSEASVSALTAEDPERTDVNESQETPPSTSQLRIKVDIHMSNGLHIKRSNMSYVQLCKFILKMEVLSVE